MKKLLVAALAIALMLAMVPLGAPAVFAETTNLVVNGDFEAGTDGWILYSWGTGGISADAAKEGSNGLYLGGGWFGATQTLTVEANTDYVVSFWVKGLAVVYCYPVMEKWPDNYSDWTYVSYKFNSGNNTTLTLELYSPDTYNTVFPGWVDNVSVTKKTADWPEEPPIVEPSFDGYIVNGDFETGDNTGWTVRGTAEIVKEAAETGEYGAKISGTATLEDRLYTIFPVDPGKTYTLSYSIKTVYGGAASLYLYGGYNALHCGIELKGHNTQIKSSGDWQNMMHVIDPGYCTYVLVYFNGAAGGTHYFDNVSITEYVETEDPDVPEEPEIPDEPAEPPVVEPSFDGYITNGDFETGDTEGWTVPIWCANYINVTESAAKSGKYGVEITTFCGSILRVAKVKPNTTYKVSVDYKGDLTIRFETNEVDGRVYRQEEWCGQADDWRSYECTITTPADTTELEIMFNCENSTFAYLAVDNISMSEVTPKFTALNNADFESGDMSGWPGVSSQVEATSEAAKSGNYGAYLKGGEWDGMYQYVDVKKNTFYEFNFDFMCVGGSAHGSMHVNAYSGGYLGDVWYIAEEGVWSSANVCFNTGNYDRICFQFCKGLSDKYIDNVTLVEVDCIAVHSYDNNCDADCNICGVVREVQHDYEAVVTARTCTEAGYTTYTCHCGDSYVTDFVDATGHKYGEWYEYQAPTTTAVGEERRTCQNCDHFESREIPKLTLSGWVQENGKWCYFENGKKVTNKWLLDSVGWCYVGADGYCVTNSWKADSKGWCYLDENGRMATNRWVRDSVGWCYVGADGYAVTNCWKKDSVGWCYLNSNGSMTKSAWVNDGGKWYYLDGNGYMVTNAWKKDSKGWVYVGSDGAMKTNAWVRDSVGWCYVGADGYAVTNCWKKDSVGWCYLNSNGSMTKNAWVQDGGKWYYLDGNGYMVSGKTVTIGGEKYTFNASGVWVA